MARLLVLGSLAESLTQFRGPLLRAVRARGHEVIACAPNAPETVRRELSEMGVVYRHVSLARAGMNPLQDVRTLLSLIALMKQTKPDLFLGYTIKPVVYGSLAARIAGVPKIFSMVEGLGYAFSGKGFKRRVVSAIAMRLYRTALRGNERIFFLNTDDVRLFQEENIIAGQEQAVMLNGIGVDLDRFSVKDFPEKISFLMIARLLRDKGVFEYVDAARMIKRRYPNVTFRLAGGFDENPSAISKHQLTAWVEENVIEYLGELADVRPAIAASTVYVLPSYREGRPVTVMEAMAMGRPVITTDVPGCRETVRHGENGLLVPAHDAQSLAKEMEYFIQHPENVKIMGCSSRTIAERDYDVNKTNKKVLEVLCLNRKTTIRRNHKNNVSL
jgi:glycosyltransferase involved in cell wall biosynthesis